MLINFTPADMMQQTVISEPEWFTFVVDDVKGPEASKNGDSQNYKMLATVVGNPKYEGKQIQTVFNNKMMGNAIPFLQATLMVQIEAGKNYDLEETKGKKFDGKVGTRPYDGRLVNEIQAYLPAGEGKNQTGNPFA